MGKYYNWFWLYVENPFSPDNIKDFLYLLNKYLNQVTSF